VYSYYDNSLGIFFFFAPPPTFVFIEKLVFPFFFSALQDYPLFPLCSATEPPLFSPFFLTLPVFFLGGAPLPWRLLFFLLLRPSMPRDPIGDGLAPTLFPPSFQFSHSDLLLVGPLRFRAFLCLEAVRISSSPDRLGRPQGFAPSLRPTR